jgi:hypothetical protein
MIRKDYKPQPLQPLQPMQQSEQSIKRWHIAAAALLVFILAVDWEATLTIWGF